MESTPSGQEFGKWRSFFWPIHKYELKKVIPMFLMFFCIAFSFTILRNTKDTLIITAPESGAEVIPFLKFWLMIPCAIIFMLVYAKLSNKLSKKRLFFATITPFLIFFALFATVLYPYREALHPVEMADRLQTFLPEGMKGLVAIFRNWTYALFYILAELWGNIMVALLFWGFSNDITKVSEAKRFYSLFGIGANIALICAGSSVVFVSKIQQKISVSLDAWDLSLKFLIGLVLLSGLLIMVIYWWIQKYVLTDIRFYDPKEQTAKKTEKPTMGFREGFLYLAKSPYILCLSILVLSYGTAINIVELTWKSQLKLQFPSPNEYSTFMGYFSTITGAVTVFMMLFVGGNVIRRFGWGTAALFTPIVLLLSGILFFGFVLFRDRFDGLILALGTTPLMLAVIVGTFQNIMTKSCKYSLFDPTKEMVYIPLDQEQKVKGKAAIDVVGARLGKGGGSLIQQGLLIMFGTFQAIVPYLALILMAVIGAWLIAVRNLNKRLNAPAPQPEKATSAIKNTSE